jgi:hypothetical protein
MSKKKIEELEKLCGKFKGPDDSLFADIVRRALSCGIDKVEIARECAVAPSTVTRWSEGTSCPGPMVQTFVVESVAALLGK